MDINRNVVALTAVAAALCGPDAIGQSTEGAPYERAAEEIVMEARARVEGRTPPGEKEPEKDDPPRSFFVGFGFEPDSHIRYGEAYRVRAEQRDNSPLHYLEPAQEGSPRNDGGALTIFAGFEVTSWMDLELALHDIDQAWTFWNFEHVHDPTLSGAVQMAEARQSGGFELASYSLSLRPRWDINDHFAIVGRVSLGYADTVLKSHLTSHGWLQPEEICNVDSNGQRKCTTSTAYETHDWGDLRQRRAGVISIFGIGLQIAQFLRLEYMIRKDVPIGDATTDISSNLYVSFRMKGAWLGGSPSVDSFDHPEAGRK